ncbi:aldehyde dehydrogenase family protein [Heyndrickxia sporothermodurans]|uniref:3-sulfolactaldehyde dehydrogenase n=1 Tax=Heyndrickxia sporothermodurans TaxID=46224 RepID=A0AB37HLD4_9BACI|nr:aldehyde dehydrogenase family protein [Heyndrickxia sporothermodurans]MBL5766217.1 aldehyde dehydrogenase family protein [Heyndrickxia sporothermodurans]MBL5769657.1 aldehyde dehydrogenase family protein [Heyndrickxia sporothermodurans]MBL5773553.1 aldehyde dehydrogenase family protein [Heyndrickxia sporothermodurans]MBL5776840.1 aldehyde dehydrogenase family protein [Heyndrickxia sporothermodurans]MBL5780415.1 aldehyde dehydrogenase family protein [Heyndrickxia sporothermodurans]
MKKKWQLWIGGKWREPKEYEALYNPHTNEEIAQIGQAEPADAVEAVVEAHAAFQKFRGYPAHARAKILAKVATIMEERSEELAKIIALEAAKSIRNAREEISRTVQTYRFAAEAAKSNYGEQIPMDAAEGGEKRFGFTIKTPIGVVTAITPFNFPFNLVAHKVGPAIAAGNSIVLKPAEQTPLSALVLAEIFKEAGLPDGVLNIIPGKGDVLSEVLTTHPHVKKVTFTGSVEVGHIIQQQAGFRKLTLELGSNSPFIIDEGVDIDQVIERSVMGSFSFNGQVCISIQRIYVHQSLYQKFVEKFVSRTKQLVVGSPLDEDTNITAVISKKSLDRIQSWIAEAVQEGATIECGGKTEGNALLPTVLTNVNRDSKVFRYEIFGPVVCIFPFDTLDDAINDANDSRYGLNSGIMTPSLERAFYAAERLETGGVIVNDIPTYRIDNMPYGGWKDSGVGREGIKYAMEEMMEQKFISFKTGE